MPIRAKLVDKELDNRIQTVTWADVLAAINALTVNEQNLIVDDIKSNSGGTRQIIVKQVRQTIKAAVQADVDGFIASGSIPVSFLNKVID